MAKGNSQLLLLDSLGVYLGLTGTADERFRFQELILAVHTIADDQAGRPCCEPDMMQ